MPPKEARNVDHQRMVENAQLKKQLIELRRARMHCVVCDLFLGDRLDESIQLASQDAGSPYLMCQKDVFWNKIVPPSAGGGWGSGKQRPREWDGEEES